MAAEGELSDRARDGVEHFQAAAKELIAASRALLDAAEELVEDPASISQLASEVSTLVRVAGSAIVRSMSAATGPSDESGADRESQRVQRIRVS